MRNNRNIFSNFNIFKNRGYKITIKARNFYEGNLNNKRNQFGKGLVIDGGYGYGEAKYKFSILQSGNYTLYSRYASEKKRPVNIYIDEKLKKTDGLNRNTGGYTKRYLSWFKEITIYLRKGEHNLRLYRKGFIPHIESFVFIKATKKDIKFFPEKFYLTKKSILKTFGDRAKQNGLLGTMRELNLRKLKDYYYEILGIFDGEYAYKGPFHMQIDLTNRCNNNCIGCWCNSPLLEEKAMSKESKEEELPLGIVKELIEEFSNMGGREIYFSGGGEPFMHPDIMEILRFAKSKKLICYINTNFTLLDKSKIDELIDIGVDHLTVSTWSGTPNTYDITHPNKDEQTFKRIIENLKYLNNKKYEIPYVKLYNVLFNLNYHEIEQMIELAKVTNSESVEFTMIDTIPGKTDKLLLNNNQMKRLQDICKKVINRMDKNGYIDGVLLFKFDSFLRRISSEENLQKATYDKNIIDRMPCYIGWLFARVLPDGNINSCLKSHRIPVGNLYSENFKSIWNSPKQRIFRKKTKVYVKNDPFFRLIGNDPDTKEAGCYKSCDDIGRNMYMHEKIMALGPLEKFLFNTLSKKFSRIFDFTKPIMSSKRKKRNLSNNLVLTGIKDGRRAFGGPKHIVIDLTNKCNQRCIGCWMYSPLLKNKDKDWLRKELSIELVKSLINELADLGAERVRYTGGGEPFLHPHIMEILQYTKTRGLKTAITTNFSLLDEDKIRKLVEWEIDEVAVSLWAGSGEVYKSTHPGESIETFNRIVGNLKFLIQLKNTKPSLTFSNVITNVNYKDILSMYKLAQEVKAESIYYTVVDVIENATDKLMLSREERDITLKLAKKVEEWNDTQSSKGRINLHYFDGFLRRLSSTYGKQGDYDKATVNSLPCYVGWYFVRIMADGTVVPCCRAVKKPMGNIISKKFKEIWFSKRYDEFRCRAKNLPKTHPYFKEIGCIKECDNLMHNEQVNKILCKEA